MKRSVQSNKLEFATSNEAITTAMMMQCCSKNCMQEHFSFNDIKACRELYNSKIEVDKSNWLLAQFNQFYDREKKEFHFVVLGNHICRGCFVMIYGVSNGKYYSTLKKHYAGVKHVVHGNCFFQHSAAKQECSRKWLAEFQEKFADTSPTDPDVAYLPMMVFHVDLFEEFIKDCIKEGMEQEDFPSMMTFLLVWRRDFKKLKCSRTIRLGRCSFCTEINLKISKATNERERTQLQLQKQIHLKNIFKMRGFYEQRKAIAKANTLVWSSWVGDYMDPIKIPHPSIFPASWLTKQRIKLEICGFLDHGNNQADIYVHTEHFSHSANLVITIFFLRLCEKVRTGKLARNLFLQADNCAKEMHNQLFFIFLAYLVQIKIFDSIQLSSLEPGHTHCDVDSEIFAVIKSLLTTVPIHDISSFITEFLPKLNKKRNRKIQATLITFLFDWQQFFQGTYHDMTGQQKVHQYRWVIPAGQQEVNFFYRPKVDEGSWIGVVEGVGFRPFITIPTGIPDIIEATPIAPEKLADIPFYFRWLPPESQSWWTNFCEDQTFFFPEKNIDLDQFWPEPPEEIEDTPSAEPADEQGPAIVIPSHPIISIRQLELGEKIIIKDDEFTEGGRNFRVGKITALYDDSCAVSLLELINHGYYIETENEDVDIGIEEVLTKIELTAKGKIHSSTLHKLSRQFQLQFNNNQ